jgi:ubiquinone/menaquinone biosynthesis C-methylase UbiE
MDFFEDGCADAVFASNLVEHLTREEFEKTLNESGRILKDGGRLCLLQPNFKYSFRNYFDDYTHVSIWTHISLADFLESKGWHVDLLLAKYLPLTLKSRLPVHPALIWLYLVSPLKPLAGQMLLVATKQASFRKGD